jgi:flagellar protein FlaJ
VLDLAEIRKTGLAPEKGIEALATRNYGSLSKYIQRMASQVSWGVPLSKVLKDFGDGLHSWFVTSIGFILLEVVEVGGATTGLFNSLAEFTQKTRDLEKERRSLFKPYIFMPYIGAILTIISTVLIINMVSTQLTKIGGTTGTGVVHVNADTSTLSNIMMMATMFQSWTMGIVAGKMGEWSVAAGYKHASALASIGLITIFVFTNFIKI